MVVRNGCKECLSCIDRFGSSLQSLCNVRVAPNRGISTVGFRTILFKKENNTHEHPRNCKTKFVSISTDVSPSDFGDGPMPVPPKFYRSTATRRVPQPTSVGRAWWIYRQFSGSIHWLVEIHRFPKPSLWVKTLVVLVPSYPKSCWRMVLPQSFGVFIPDFCPIPIGCHWGGLDPTVRSTGGSSSVVAIDWGLQTGASTHRLWNESRWTHTCNWKISICESVPRKLGVFANLVLPTAAMCWKRTITTIGFKNLQNQRYFMKTLCFQCL